MRFACLLLVLAACGGPITPPYVTHNQSPSDPDPRVFRAPTNAPPDPIGTVRPGNRSCSETRDCKAGEMCFAPDFVPRAPGAASAVGGGSGGAAGSGLGSGASSSTASGAAGAAGSGVGSAARGPAGAAGSGVGSAASGPAGAAGSGMRTAASGAPLQCQGDAQCTAGLICALGACVAPCVEGSCGPGLECRAGGRCMPIACSAPGAPVCSQNFRCNGGSGSCERQACTSRSQCDSGVCFQGRCYAHDAYCMPPQG